MKKKYFMGVAAAALIAGGFAMSKNSTGNVLTPLQAENLEALSGDETKHQVPCFYMSGQKCIVESETIDHKPITVTYQDMIKTRK